jgi:hypothetical protein
VAAVHDSGDLRAALLAQALLGPLNLWFGEEELAGEEGFEPSIS